MVEVQSVIDVKTLTPVEGSGLDLTEFEGVKTIIEDVTVVEVPSQFTKASTGKQECLKVVSKVVTQLDMGDGTKKDIRASELFNLTRDQNTGKLGWSKHKKASLNKFLVKMKAKTPFELIGKPVIIKTRQHNEKTFLGFVKE